MVYSPSVHVYYLSEEKNASVQFPSKTDNWITWPSEEHIRDNPNSVMTKTIIIPVKFST